MSIAIYERSDLVKQLENLPISTLSDEEVQDQQMKSLQIAVGLFFIFSLLVLVTTCAMNLVTRLDTR